MSDKIKEEQIVQFPKGDIYHNFQVDDSEEKFDYLKAKYIFRFPFTMTAIKWGFSLGTIFGIHTYIKSKSIQNSLYWFIWGSILSGMPIWGFFMFKYSFYTMTLRKFEVDQYQQLEDTNLLREYMRKKVDSKVELDDENLVKVLEKKQQNFFMRQSKLDDVLESADDEEFELKIKKQN